MEFISLEDFTNFKTPAEQFNPYRWYRQMLDNERAIYHRETNTWHAFRYADVKQVLSNHEYFSSERTRTILSVGADNSEGKLTDKMNILNVDPPNHRKSRSLLSAAFTPHSLQLWEPRIQEVINGLIHDMAAQPKIDIVNQFAIPLPIIVMAELLGVPSLDRLQFKKWVDILFLPLGKENNHEIIEQKRQAAMEYYTYLYPIVVAKRSNPDEDIISDLIKAEVDGETFTDDEIVRVTMFLLGAGVETTSHLLANSFYSLLYDDPKVYDQLRNNIDLVPNTVEEILRYRFNITKLDRTVKRDNDLLGVNLKKGDVVIVWMNTANLDERVFENPFAFDIHRPNNSKHLTFGFGPHFCLGAPLARLEAKLAIKLFVEKFSRIEAVDHFNLEENLQTSAMGQSLIHLPLKVHI
jgi:cytochrome P450